MKGVRTALPKPACRSKVFFSIIKTPVSPYRKGLWGAQVNDTTKPIGCSILTLKETIDDV
jgi:hypothetical protein